MSTIIHFKPLYGALSEDPICYLLVIDDCKILLDCGWNDFFDTNLLKPLQEYVFSQWNATVMHRIRLLLCFILSIGYY
jgi:Cft2 family RNA processing exonuclease